MNNLTQTRPRFGCQIVRFSRALFEHTGNSHVSACADCQAYYRVAAGLEQNLSRAAALQRREAPESSPDLVRGILRAVREEKTGRQSKTAHSRMPLWAMGAVAAGAILTALYFQGPMSNSTATSSEDALAVVDAVETLTAKFNDTVIPVTGAMVANNPLQRELGSAYSDARSALHFLALNFLPPTTASNANPPGSRI